MQECRMQKFRIISLFIKIYIYKFTNIKISICIYLFQINNQLTVFCNFNRNTELVINTAFLHFCIALTSFQSSHIITQYFIYRGEFMLKEKHVFAGNNSSKGFWSYFESIIKPEEAKRILILKGGPGVGKSSFMKKFGSRMADMGYSIEYIHCSSDENSLDGVMIPELQIIMVDGTAPHTIDPKLPGAADEIVNLGVFINNKELLKHKNNIIQINKKKSQLYKSAYRYLESAGLISEEINSIYDSFTDEKLFNELCFDSVSKIFGNEHDIKINYYGTSRKMFSEAYTSNGYINYTSSYYEGKKVIAVVGENINYISRLLDFILSEAIKRGLHVDCFYRPLTPDKIQHIFIPDLNAMIISSDNHLSCDYDEIINLHEIMDLDNLKAHISEIENNLHLYDLLINNALDKLADAKKYHELLEVIYVNSMDFEGVNQCFDKYFDSLLNKV